MFIAIGLVLILSAFGFEARPARAELAPVPAGNKLVPGTHVVGTQNYICKPSGAGVAYVVFVSRRADRGDLALL